jgi:hypothetical protein
MAGAALLWPVRAAFALPLDSTATFTAGFRITSEPDSAIVFLDGVRRGSTPLDAVGLSPGVHTLRIVARDLSNWLGDVRRDTIDLQAGSVLPLHYRLDRRVAIITAPSGAEVLFGDSLAGTTPLVVPLELLQDREILVRKRGYAGMRVSLPPEGESTVVLSLSADGTTQDQGPEMPKNGSSPRMTGIWLAAGGVVVSGTAAAYFKISADEKNTAYLNSGDPGLRAERDHRDVAAAVSLVIMEASAVLLARLLLAE